MNVGSLFSGIGGLDLGLARAGFRHAFFCESDPWRRGVLAHHWPGVPIYEDVREVDATAWAARIGEGRRAVGGVSDNPSDNPSLLDASRAGSEHAQEPARSGMELRPGGDLHLLCGGFPCQDVSVAGRRAGLAGARSGLFHEFARIAESLRPQWILVENVPGLLSSNGGRDFGVVLGTLADIGYGVAWRIVDSRFFGVPQRRRRVFVLGALAESDTRGAAERAGEVLAVGTRCPGHPATGAEARENAAVASLSGLGSGGPDDNDGQGGRIVSYALNAKAGYRDGDADTNYVADELAYLTRKLRRSVASESTGVRRLTPRECERLQDLPDDWTAHGPDSRRYAALGDAVTASVSEWIGVRLLSGARNA